MFSTVWLMSANPAVASRAGLAGAFACIAGMSLSGCASPLINAAHEGDTALVRTLLKSGENPNVEYAGFAVLHYAALEGHTEALAVLIEAGADVNVATTGLRGGYTALHYAAMKGHKEAVAFLLDHGADTNLRAENRTPRQLAQDEEHADVARLIAAAETSRGAGMQPDVAAVVVPPLRLPKSLLVLPLRGEGGVAEHAPGVLTQVLLTELQAVPGMQTHSVDDLQAMLTVEKQKDLLGCDSTTCLAELAGALGTDLVLYGSLGKLGASVSWSVSVLEPSTGRVAGRASVTVQGGEEKLAPRARMLVADLVTKLNDGLGTNR